MKKFEASAFYTISKNRPLFMTEKDAVKCINLLSQIGGMFRETRNFRTIGRGSKNKITQKISEGKKWIIDY